MYYLWNLKLYLHNKYVFKVSRNGGFFLQCIMSSEKTIAVIQGMKL